VVNNIFFRFNLNFFAALRIEFLSVDKKKRFWRNIFEAFSIKNDLSSQKFGPISFSLSNIDGSRLAEERRREFYLKKFDK
jgi:hypothetical protein